MHELSIAQNIVEIIQQSVPQHEWTNVRVVRLKVGTLSGVVPDSLDFCFGVISSQTSFPNAKLEIQRIPFAVHCSSCNETIINEVGVVVCQSCGSVETEVISGRELQVTEVELDNDQGKSI